MHGPAFEAMNMATSLRLKFCDNCGMKTLHVREHFSVTVGFLLTLLTAEIQLVLQSESLIRNFS